MDNKISVILITKNEEKRISQALDSVKWADEIVVVDSYSSDNTIRIVKEYTDKIYQRELDDFSSQKNFAVSKCANNWVLSIDSDEIVSYKLRDSLTAAVNFPDDYSAFRVKRINRLFGKVLRFACGNDYPIRLFRKDKAEFIQPVHEFLDVKEKIGKIKAELMHNSTVDIESEFRKTEHYTELEAEWLIKRNVRPSIFKLLFYPQFIFWEILLLKKGILDGKAGIIYAFVSARYSFVKYLKARKLSKNQRYLERMISERFNDIFEQFPSDIDGADSRLNCLLNELPNTGRKIILEVGCGKGRFINAVKKINSDGICVGIDASENLLKKAVIKNKGIFLGASAVSLPFKQHSFDAVFAVEVIEHLPDLEGFIEEAARVLKPNGKLAIIDRNILSINNRRNFIPNFIIKKYHENKNDWMYPRGFVYTEKWFLGPEVNKILNRYFDNTKYSYVISDSEQKSPTKFLFKTISIARHFILWKASFPKT